MKRLLFILVAVLAAGALGFYGLVLWVLSPEPFDRTEVTARAHEVLVLPSDAQVVSASGQVTSWMDSEWQVTFRISDDSDPEERLEELAAKCEPRLTRKSRSQYRFQQGDFSYDLDYLPENRLFRLRYSGL